MAVKKFGFSSLFLLLVSAASTGLTSQAGLAATSSSYSTARQPSCGCPHQPYWGEKGNPTYYRPPIDCLDVFPHSKPAINGVYCPDFRRVSQFSTKEVLLIGIGGDEGRWGSLPSRGAVLWRTLTPSVANPVGSQPAPGETGEAFLKRTGRSDGRSPAEVGPARGAGGRDAEQRERNLESGHRGFGGPQ